MTGRGAHRHTALGRHDTSALAGERITGAVERAHPEAMTHEDGVRRARLIVGGGKRAANLRGHAEYTREVGRDARAGDDFR